MLAQGDASKLPRPGIPLALAWNSVLFGQLVGATGVEPARISPQDPKSCVSANSTTRPALLFVQLHHAPPVTEIRRVERMNDQSLAAKSAKLPRRSKTQLRGTPSTGLSPLDNTRSARQHPP